MKLARLFIIVLMLVVVSSVLSFAGTPTISSTTPANGAVNVSVSDPIIINFSETVTWGSVYNNGTYRIQVFEVPNSRFAALNYTPTGDSASYTLTPTTSLKFSTQYRVDISRNVRSFTGNTRMPADASFIFTTEAVPDTVAPTASASFPLAGGVNVSLGSTITVQFSEPMNPTTINNTTFTLDNGVTGTVTYDSSGNSATFTPSSPLAGNTTFTATIGTGATDLAGNHLAANYSWSFRTLIPDTTPPTILTTNPVSDATSVPVASAITINFSEPMDPSTITASNISIAGVTGTVSYNSGTYVATFVPSASLDFSTNYTVTVTTSVRDMAGNSLAANRVWTFTTTYDSSPPNVNTFCQIPPFIAGTGVKPNLLLMLDNSGSMAEFAYKAAGKGGGAGTGADSSYNAANSYYGYFDSEKMYKFITDINGNHFQIDTTKSLLKTDFWSGNFLNWLTMRRVDVVRKVLVGGKTSPRTASTSNYLKLYNDTDRDYYKSYAGIWYRIDAGPRIRVCSTSSCSGYSATYNTFDVLYGNDPPVDGVVLQYSDHIRMGVEVFNVSGVKFEDGGTGEKDGGKIVANIGSTQSQLISAIEAADPDAWTPLAESFYEAIRYFQSTDSAYNSGGYSASDPITESCQRNFVMILTDGESTKDRNVPGGNWSGNVSKVTDSYGLNVKTWMDAIGTNESATSLYATTANDSGGTYYLPGLAYYAHNTDLRSTTVGRNNVEGNQNLTTYTVFAFDDSAVGRNLLKLTAKYGGYEDLNSDGKPNSVGEWDNSGDGVPDTYFEADAGDKLFVALDSAFRDMINKVSSGTAASILNNSEGSGASLLQAVFYPKKDFSAGTSASWIGEVQNLWYYLDPFLALSSIRVDSGTDNKLNTKDDYIANFYFDPSAKQTRVQLLKDVNGTGTTLTSMGTYLPDDTENVKSLWRAGRNLWSRNLGDDPRKIFTRTGKTALDSVLNSQSESTGLALFNSSISNDADVMGYLRAANDTEALKLINYVRGTDQNGYRPRAVTIGTTSGTWRLGDVISSTPKISANNPLNSYDKAAPTGYNDKSYLKYIESNNYANRGMAYVGANDGMLHAFRMGVMKEATDPCRQSGATADCRFEKAQINDYSVNTTSGANNGKNLNIKADAADELGKEEWAFVPKQMFPYLKFLSDPTYPHLFYVDGTPTVIDMSISTPSTYNTTAYPECSTKYWECPKQSVYGNSGGFQTKNLDLANTSWRTILIVGSGLGGASRNKTDACVGGGSGCVKTPIPDLGYSSYFALDVTDPKEPKYMWEFYGDPANNKNLGFATSGPAVLRVGATNKNGRWFAVFASGPTGPINTTTHQFMGQSDQPLHLFVVDVATGTLVRTITTTIDNAYAGSVSNSTIDTDKSTVSDSGHYQDDAAYIGYVQKNTSVVPNTWTRGGVIRLLTKESTDPANWEWSPVVSGIGPVTSAVTKLQDRANHELWLYFGSGRYFYKNGTIIDDADSGRRLYGIKEPCYTSTNKINPSCSAAAVSTGSLKDQTTSPSATLATGDTGWYVNLDSSGDGLLSERVITDPVAAPNGGVFFTTFRPTNDVCGYGGSSFIWAVDYRTGGTPAASVMKGKVLLQVSTGAFADINMSSAFTAKDGRRTATAIQGVPPKSQGLSLLTNPKPTKKILHIQER